MLKLKKFDTIPEDYEWPEETVTLVDERGWYKADLTTRTKSAKVAINRFFKALENVPGYYCWKEFFTESIAYGYWKDNDLMLATGENNENVSFVWEVEEVSDDVWYIFLNLRKDVHCCLNGEEEDTDQTEETTVDTEETTEETTSDLPKIETKCTWNVYNVRKVCIDNDLYTRGDCEEYEAMFEMVRSSDPTDEMIYRVAKDICNHSWGQTITNVMFLLINYAVRTTYLLDGRDDI